MPAAISRRRFWYSTLAFTTIPGEYIQLGFETSVTGILGTNGQNGRGPQAWLIFVIL